MNMMNPQLPEQIAALRRTIDRRVDELVDRDMPAAAFGEDSTPLAENARRAALAVARQARSSSEGGKRLRALLTIAAAGNQSQALDLACAIEIFQTGALVHDDIIDASDLRRGIPSAWKGLESDYGFIAGLPTGTENDGNDASASNELNVANGRTSAASPAAHAQGTGLALMLGDMLATLSIRIAVDSSANRPNAAQFLTTFLQMQHDVEVGQVLDMADDLISLADPAAIARNCEIVYAKKTSSYTTIAPLQLGFLAAGVPNGAAHYWAQAIGGPLGLAFQIADDLADIAPVHPTGKPLYGDIRSGKRSILLSDALEAATNSQKRNLARIYSKPERTDDDITEVLSIFKSTGAIERSHCRIHALWLETTDAIDKFADRCANNPTRTSADIAYASASDAQGTHTPAQGTHAPAHVPAQRAQAPEIPCEISLKQAAELFVPSEDR